MTESTHSLAPASAPRLASSLDNKWEMTVSLSLTGETTEELWSLYRRAFDSLRTRAAQRHIMSRAEFDEQMSDERIDKIVVRDRTYDLRPACLSLMTNQRQRFRVCRLLSQALARTIPRRPSFVRKLRCRGTGVPGHRSDGHSNRARL